MKDKLWIVLAIILSITLAFAGEDEPVDLTKPKEGEVIYINPDSSISTYEIWDSLQAGDSLPVNVGQISFDEQVTLSIAGFFSLDDALKVSLPRYPEWAEEQGITSFSAVLYFTVDVDGNVNPFIPVVKSSGYPNWDYMVKQALMEWRFVPDPDEQMETRTGYLKISYDLMPQ